MKKKTKETTGWALDRVYNSSPPVTLTTDLILIDGRGLTMDYPCAKFCELGFSQFDFIMRTDTQTHTQNYTQMPLNALLPRLLSA